MKGKALAISPRSVIDLLAERYGNEEIDWEGLLESAYRAFLGPQSHVLDIGAHLGRHADVMIRELDCARVDLVEPLPYHAAELRERYQDRPEQVRVHACALGRDTGRVPFLWNGDAPEESGLRRRRYSDPEATYIVELEVELRRLDDLVADFTRLDFIKMDTEGGEMDILDAGRQTLSRFRPLLSVEWGADSYEVYGKTQNMLFEFAQSTDFVICDLFGHPFLSEQAWADGADLYYWDFFMVPRERLASVVIALSGQLARLDPEIASVVQQRAW